MTPRRLALACAVYVAALGAAYTWIRSVTPPGGWAEVGVVVFTLVAHAAFLMGLMAYDERRKRMGSVAEDGEAPGTTLVRRPWPLVAATLGTFLPLPIMRFALNDFSMSGFARGMIMTVIALLAALVGIVIVRYGYRDLA
ncbi:hypothetical protein EON79_18775 [bacterium]|nr:MAG: hypothetical protein EON79_18775 [bacterium]